MYHTLVPFKLYFIFSFVYFAPYVLECLQQRILHSCHNLGGYFDIKFLQKEHIHLSIYGMADCSFVLLFHISSFFCELLFYFLYVLQDNCQCILKTIFDKNVYEKQFFLYIRMCQYQNQTSLASVDCILRPFD